jgi:hypothetical protein
MFSPQLRDLAMIIDIIADIVFFTTAGCMNAQSNYEIEYRSALGGPTGPTTIPTVTVMAPASVAYGAPTSPELADGLPTEAEEPMER